MLSVVKMLLKGEVGSHALNSHGNNIVDHGKIMELCFLISVGTLTDGLTLKWQILFGGLPRKSKFVPHKYKFYGINCI